MSNQSCLNTVFLSLMAASITFTTLTCSAASTKKSGSTLQSARLTNYKGEILSKSARATNYKGEISTRSLPPSKIYKTATKPVMNPIILNDGPYLGAALGYDSYKVHELSQFTGTTNFTYNPDINATGLIGALMAGYGHYFNNALYLGFEVFVNLSEAYQSTNSSISDTTDVISYNSKFFVSAGYGASLLPGIKLSDSSLVFLRLAYQIARLRGQENVQDNGVTTIVSNSSSWNGGFSYGLGFEEAMVGNFSLRGEYIHTDYRSFTSTDGTQYSPSNNQFMLSLIYHVV